MLIITWVSNRVTSVLVLENMALTLLEIEGGDVCSYYGYVPVDHLLSVSVNGYPLVTSRALEFGQHPNHCYGQN